MTQQAEQIIAKFEAADKRWHHALLDAFGIEQAAQARYEPRGRGEEGTPLRTSWQIREHYRLAWEAAA